MAESKYKKSIYLLIAVFVVLQAAVALLMLENSMTDYFNDIIINTLVFSAILYFNVKLKLDINIYVILMTLFVLILNHLFGEYMNLNNSSPIYNRVQHFLGTYSITLLFYIIVIKLSGQIDIHSIVEFIFIVSFGVCLGVFVEIEEFVKDSVFKPKETYQLGLVDTNFDLISDIFGAFAAAIHFRLKKKLFIEPHIN